MCVRACVCFVCVYVCTAFASTPAPTITPPIASTNVVGYVEIGVGIHQRLHDFGVTLRCRDVHWSPSNLWSHNRHTGVSQAVTPRCAPRKGSRHGHANTW